MYFLFRSPSHPLHMGNLPTVYLSISEFITYFKVGVHIGYLELNGSLAKYSQGSYSHLIQRITLQEGDIYISFAFL